MVTFRVTEDEKERLIEAADRADLSLHAHMREVVLNGTGTGVQGPVSRLMSELRKQGFAPVLYLRQDERWSVADHSGQKPRPPPQYGATAVEALERALASWYEPGEWRIEKDVPLPEPEPEPEPEREVLSREPWPRMEAGDSFKVRVGPGLDNQAFADELQRKGGMWCDNHRPDLTVRALPVDGGVRVWMVDRYRKKQTDG